MRNNNTAIVRKIINNTLSSDKKRNFFVIAAIILTTFMIASVFSIGISYYASINMREKRMLGSISQMAFASPTEEQLAKISTLDYVKTVGIGAPVAQATDMPKLNDLSIFYVDQTQWNDMFCPTFTNIVGHYPKNENEVMLSRHILDEMGIENPRIGMTIPISFAINNSNEVKTETFILSCIYTEYTHSGPNGVRAIYCSSAFAEKYDMLTNNNIVVNVIFKSATHIDETIERLKQDLAFSSNQQYIQSPAFDNQYGNTTTYITLFLLIIFLMFTGYLLIYNVMYISVSRDVRFYGMLKTLGTTPRQIRRIVVGQVLRFCLIALPSGCAASAAVSLLIVPAILKNSGIDTGAVVSFSPIIYIGAILFTAMTAILGAITPAKKAANITPIEALKYTGEYPDKSNFYRATNGKPYKMAYRNIFRDHKRAAVVMLSLFLGIMVFSLIMTIVTSIDIDYRVNAEYDYDFSFSSTLVSSSFLKEDFVNEVKTLAGITETGITTIEPIELIYSKSLDKYVDWLCKNYNSTREDIIKNNVFEWMHGIKGIDLLTLKEINKSLPTPIDVKAFERGEIALINIGNEDVADCFTGVSTFDIRRDSDDIPVPIVVGGIVSLKKGSFSYPGTEILVSNAFMQQLFPQPQILSLDANVENGQDELVYNAMNKMINPNEVMMVSRYGGRIAIQDAKTIMFVLGGGISVILGFIGIFNFVNVMSVGVMARRRELATIESIGMSKKQVQSMLRNEGIGYVAITLLSALTFGNLMVYGVFCLFKNIEEYARFTYPFIPVIVMYAVIVLICLITPELAYRSMSRLTLVERLREAE